MSRGGWDHQPAPPLSAAKRARLLREPQWYVYGKLAFPESCMGCNRKLEEGDVVMCVWGSRLIDKRMRGHCCPPPPKSLITNETLVATDAPPTPRKRGFFG